MVSGVKLGRVMIGVIFLLSALAACWAAWEAFTGQIEFVNVFAGSAAVIAAAISALVAFRSAELTEERLKPYPYPFIDTSSRYSLAQLRIRNVGGSAAHEVYLEWKGKSIPKVHSQNKEGDIPFLGNGKENAIAVILPYESLSQALDVPYKVSEQAKTEGDEWHGMVCFKDSKGQRHKHPFMLDVTNLGRGLLYDSEEPKTMYELQKLPKEIEKLTKAVKELRPPEEF